MPRKIKHHCFLKQRKTAESFSIFDLISTFMVSVSIQFVSVNTKHNETSKSNRKKVTGLIKCSRDVTGFIQPVWRCFTKLQERIKTKWNLGGSFHFRYLPAGDTRACCVSGIKIKCFTECTHDKCRKCIHKRAYAIFFPFYEHIARAFVLHECVICWIFWGRQKINNRLNFH